MMNFKSFLYSGLNAAIISLTFILSGCAPQYPSPTPATLSMWQTQFKNGDAKLACTGCAGSYSWAEDTLRADYQNQDWTNLVNKVLEIGYPIDVSWFYLGRAAEELGYYDAAKKYYIASDEAQIQCDGGDTCNGINMIDEVNQHLQNVEADLNPPSPTSPRPIPPQILAVAKCIMHGVARIALDNGVESFSASYGIAATSAASWGLQQGLSPNKACQYGIQFVMNLVNQYGWFPPGYNS